MNDQLDHLRRDPTWSDEPRLFAVAVVNGDQIPGVYMIKTHCNSMAFAEGVRLFFLRKGYRLNGDDWWRSENLRVQVTDCIEGQGEEETE